MTAWIPRGQPFCFLLKDALRIIDEQVEESATAVLVYLGLTRIASNEGNESFSKPAGYIARMSFVNRRTVLRRIPELEKAGLVKVRRTQIPGTKAHDLNTYTLVTLSRKGGDTKSSPGDLVNGLKGTVIRDHRDIREGKAPSKTDQISREKQIRSLEVRIKELEGETADQWQRDAHPHLVKEKKAKKEQLCKLQEAWLK